MSLIKVFVSYNFITNENQPGFGSMVLELAYMPVGWDDIQAIKDYIIEVEPQVKECVIINYIRMEDEDILTKMEK